jgi:hypothetical protein
MGDTYHTDADLPAPPADTFKALFDLLGLVKDASACEMRLASLRQKHSAIRSAQKKLDADRAAFAEYEKTARAEIEAERAEVGQIYTRARQMEAAAEANAPDRKADRQRIHELEVQLGMHAGDRDFTRIEGTTISRDYRRDDDIVTIRTDDHGHSLGGITRTAKRADLPAAIRPMRDKPNEAA